MFLWNRPESLFIKSLLRMVQHLSSNSHLAPFSITGKMPVPQRVNFLVEQAGKPVHKKLIENDATSQFKLTSCTILNNRQDACFTKSEFSCGTGRKACS